MLGQINLRSNSHESSANDTNAMSDLFGDSSAGTGRVSMLYRSSAANLWQSWLYTFSPLLKQTWEVMLQKQTSIRYGVDGLPPGISLDSKSEERSGLEYAGSFIRLGEIHTDDRVTAAFVLRATDLEMTNTYRYVMTVPGVLTTMGGTLTAVLYVILAPLAVYMYCLWKKCVNGGWVLDTENEPNKPVIDETMIDQAPDTLSRHSVTEPEQGTRKADQI